MGNGATTSEECDRLAKTIRTGFFGNPEEIEEAEASLTILVSTLDQALAAIERYRIQYGEAIADPLTELRLRLQRGE